MPPRTPIVVALLVALMAPTAAVAQTDSVQVEVEARSGGELLDTVDPGEDVFVFANVTVPDRNETAWRGYLNGTVNDTRVGSVVQQADANGTIELFFRYEAPQDPGTYDLSYNVTVQSRDTSGNGTADNGTEGNQTDGNATAGWRTERVETGELGFQVQALEAPEPGIPWGALAPWLIGAAVVVAGGGAAYWWRQRDRQIRGTARSQAMQDLEGESFEQAEDDPEVDPELKILEARAEDVRRMIELAKERYEAGEITEHQYETIRDRKEDELEEIQAEMDEHREQG
jgi:hypothetical protein